MTRLQASAIRIDITPPDLTELNPIGGGSFRGVHDPIHGRVLVLASGPTTVVIVALDLVEVGDMRDLRARLAALLGVPAAHVIVTASHSHNAPRLGEVSPGALAHGGRPEQRAYSAWVYDRVAAAVEEAHAALRPARLAVGTGAVDICINRDVLKDGRWELGLNPDLPSDKEVRVLRFDDEAGAPIAVWFLYGVHSTASLWTGLVSGDIAGAAERWVERELGAGSVAMFSPGALGDQAPRISLGNATDDPARDERFAFDVVDAQGALLGDEVVRLCAAMGEGDSDVPLSSQERVIASPTRRGQDVMSTMKQADVESVDLRVGVLRLGHVIVAHVGGELVGGIARRIRLASAWRETIVMSLANDRIGYLVDEEAFDRGTFEARGCPIARGHAEPAITAALAEMVPRPA